jgi:hypothetical protein
MTEVEEGASRGYDWHIRIHKALLERVGQGKFNGAVAALTQRGERGPFALVEYQNRISVVGWDFSSRIGLISRAYTRETKFIVCGHIDWVTDHPTGGFEWKNGLCSRCRTEQEQMQELVAAGIPDIVLRRWGPRPPPRRFIEEFKKHSNRHFFMVKSTHAMLVMIKNQQPFWISDTRTGSNIKPRKPFIAAMNDFIDLNDLPKRWQNWSSDQQALAVLFL